MTNEFKNQSLDLGADESFLETELPEKIGKSLRKIYDDVLEEPIPDDFLKLLSQADRKKS